MASARKKPNTSMLKGGRRERKRSPGGEGQDFKNTLGRAKVDWGESSVVIRKDPKGKGKKVSNSESEK